VKAVKGKGWKKGGGGKGVASAKSRGNWPNEQEKGGGCSLGVERVGGWEASLPAARRKETNAVPIAEKPTGFRAGGWRRRR